MANKNRLLLTLAAAMLAAGMTATAFAAPGNFSVKADELEYDLGSGEAVAKRKCCTDAGWRQSYCRLCQIQQQKQERF